MSVKQKCCVILSSLVLLLGQCPEQCRADCSGQLMSVFRSKGFSEGEAQDLVGRVCQKGEVLAALSRLEEKRQRSQARQAELLKACGGLYSSADKIGEILKGAIEGDSKAVVDLVAEYPFLNLPMLLPGPDKLIEDDSESREFPDNEEVARQSPWSSSIEALQIDSERCVKAYGRKCFQWWPKYEALLVERLRQGKEVEQRLQALSVEMSSKFQQGMFHSGCFLDDLVQCKPDKPCKTAVGEDQAKFNHETELDLKKIRRSSPSLTTPELRVQFPPILGDTNLKFPVLR